MVYLMGAVALGPEDVYVVRGQTVALKDPPSD
jgi:hypothetical protein